MSNTKRNKSQREKLTLRIRLIILVTFEIIISILLALIVDEICVWLLKDFWTIPLVVELLLTAIFVGIFATRALTRWFLDPINRLGEAMQKITDGDFSVRLENKTTIKEIKNIFKGFNVMAKELESTEIVQSDFVSNVSHEFKTPINAIEGYSMLLQDEDNLTPEQREYVEKIIFNTQRLSRLTGSILLLSKLENQSIVSTKNKFNLAEQIRMSILALESEWEQKEIEFDIELDEIEYLGSESLLYHIWDNLISNAIKFSNIGGEVKIHLQSSDDKIIFTISDNGPGISNEIQKHIFSKFYQGDSSHKEQGNGLGLALVKKIIDLEGGEISIHNNDDKGCTFTVILNK